MTVIRKTKGLSLVLDMFEKKNESISVVALIEVLKNNMNRTTVYRILDRLENQGVLHSFNSKDGLKWYAKCDGCTTHAHSDMHPHFQCTDCDKIECIEVKIDIPILTSRKINTTEILLLGQCEACSA